MIRYIAKPKAALHGIKSKWSNNRKIPDNRSKRLISIPIIENEESKNVYKINEK